MIKRILSLKNIGRFKDCKSGGLELAKLTIVFGRNTYGKSTLGDLLASIQGNDGQLVSGRLTIPNDGCPQRIQLSLLPPGNVKEISLNFEEGSWSPPLPESLEIRAFDDGFIHRNVFNARQFNRDTKENFSAFVLGEQGVGQAMAIAEKKQARQRASRERNQLLKAAFENVDDLPSFLKMTPSGTLGESDEKLNNLRNEHAAVRKQQEHSQEIHVRDEGVDLVWGAHFADGLKALNETIALGLEGAHKEAKARVAKHIESAFQSNQRAEQWIRQGVRQNNGELCQFCGQGLSDDAHSLLDLYREAFDSAFDEHDAAIKVRLAKALSHAGSLPVDNLRVVLAKNSAAFSAYPELATSQAFASSVSKSAELAARIETKLAAVVKELPDALQRLNTVSSKKRESSHLVIGAVDEDLVVSLEIEIQSLVDEYNAVVTHCNAEISSFKKSTNEADLKQRLKTIEASGKAERRINSRIKLASQCDRHMSLDAEIGKLEKEISTLEIKLKEAQSDYLKSFYVSLNEWFNKFGSHDFELERGENKQGHTPIYFLKVKFKGKTIDESSLSQVFSESDRRALALALFWTQLQSLDEATLGKQIVILDDPLTSFDDHRITAVHRELASTVDRVRQVIVLSHYRHEIGMFLEKFQKHTSIRLLNLVKRDGSTTEIEDGDAREFILTEHQKAHERIRAFVKSETNDHSSGDLRIFLEIEIDSRFAAQIAEHKLADLSLGEKIDKLFEHDVIDQEIRGGCHSWRNVLNPSHHTWTNADLEDQRNTVGDFLDFVYNRLIRKQ